MAKSYASSVYSQKSTASAKSGRSFLSFTAGATIWPSFTTNNDKDEQDTTPPDSLNQAKQGIWKNLKNWIPSTKKGTLEDDTNTLNSSPGSLSSSTTSLGKWKKLLVSPTQNKNRQVETNKSLQPETTLTTSFIDTTSLSDKESSIPIKTTTTTRPNQPGGILVNIIGGSAQDMAEQEKRRKQRRLYLMRVQQQQQQQQQQSTHRISTSSASFGFIDHEEIKYKSKVGFSEYSSSSSSTLLPTPPDDSLSMLDKLENENDDSITTTTFWYSATPRVMFVEPSPVPRFRNEPPAPPPSPPYLNVIVQPDPADTNPIERHSLIAENDHSDIPTIFTTLPQQIHHHQHHYNSHPEQHQQQRRPRLVFTSPLERGQTIAFSLQNAIPDDHIIIYKFLTSNTKLSTRLDLTTTTTTNTANTATATAIGAASSSSSSSWTTSSLMGRSSSNERYFVRPSAGLMAAGEPHSDIMLFLNQVPPPLGPGEILKDKILIRWAVIQRGTRVEAWTRQLKESNRRKWLEMLLEEWPDQVVERRTRINIRFV